MEAKDIFQKVFIDDKGVEFRIVSANEHLNVIINGKRFFDIDVPYKILKGVKHFFSVYDCIRCVGAELNIYYSAKEHKYIAMIGIVNANLNVLN